MHVFPCNSMSSSFTLSTRLSTATDSPVNDACSTRTVAVFNRITRQSAGTRSPVFSSTTSPGTNSRASSEPFHRPSLRHFACSLCISFSASSARSALLSCHTPTIAFSTKISAMTAGSAYAASPSSAPPSAYASASDTAAAASSTFTSASSNCSSTSLHSAFPGSRSSSLCPPARARRSSTDADAIPTVSSLS